MRFIASELKTRIDILVKAGVEVIEIEKGFGRECFIGGYKPHVPEHDEVLEMLVIREED